jgi:hypothetical protein
MTKSTGTEGREPQSRDGGEDARRGESRHAAARRRQLGESLEHRLGYGNILEELARGLVRHRDNE